MQPHRNFRHLERLFGIAWHDLVQIEPALEELLRTARHTSGICRRRADVDQLFAPIRKSLAELVGSAGKNVRHPVLGSTKAYEIAYWKLYDEVAVLLLSGTIGTEAPCAARIPSMTLSITRWPRYVPLPKKQAVASCCEDRRL
jgi:hypothetical protein